MDDLQQIQMIEMNSQKKEADQENQDEPGPANDDQIIIDDLNPI